MARLSPPNWSTTLKLRNATLTELLWKPTKIALPSAAEVELPARTVPGVHAAPELELELLELPVASTHRPANMPLMPGHALGHAAVRHAVVESVTGEGLPHQAAEVHVARGLPR